MGLHALLCVPFLLGFEVPIDSKSIHISVHVICVSCDLPAKALVQNFMQFNGLYGCGYCEQSGEVVTTMRGGSVTTFPYIKDNPTGPARTFDKCLRDSAEAVANHTVVH